jgi:hypothetical protein
VGTLLRVSNCSSRARADLFRELDAKTDDM